MDRQQWLLQILTTPSSRGQALGPTHLMKLAFLIAAKHPESFGPDYYKFGNGNYGPSDTDVFRDARGLAEKGLVDIAQTEKHGAFGGYKVYWPSVAGWQESDRVRGEHPELADTLKYLDTLVAWALPLSMSSLVKSVYAAYPEFRSGSAFFTE